jgi:hypothetical protein
MAFVLLKAILTNIITEALVTKILSNLRAMLMTNWDLSLILLEFFKLLISFRAVKEW